MSVMGRHAVVMGASMGGLVAARVLAGRFDRVTLLDRDSLPADARDRKGVPQSPHAHALLISGRQKLDKLFPKLTQELIAGGAVPFDPGCDLLFHQMGALRASFSSGMLGISATRAFLEHAVRERIRALPNVTVRDETAVAGLTGVRGRVTGVTLDGGEEIRADLVVDATGRSANRSEDWLRDLGYPAPEVVRIKIDVGYTTRLLRREPGDRMLDEGLLFLMSAVPPHDKRAAAVFAIEGGRWMVTLGGWHRSHAPVDPAGFEKFAAELPAPHVAELLSRAEPLDASDARRFTYPAARRRYFEHLRTVPAGYVALGDAICSFNPLYGQGMTVAVMEALALASSLDRFRTPSAAMARSYYKGAARALATPWQMATGSDFVYPETDGPRPFGNDLVNRYVREAMLATHVSPQVHRVMMDLQHLLAPPTTMFRPRTVVRTLLAARRSPARRTATTTPAG
ncbi:NAD(P)/FAD-dependent oxidoreductase [Streptomyces sp. NPDC058848]|uniref:NAD(P)/FAD-dependent oxidoreductase n=1 Tax=unclassified Streptomyces TaxID=2593676 RepID=UPI0036A3BA7B